MACYSCCTSPPGPGIQLLYQIRLADAEKCGTEQFQVEDNSDKAGVDAPATPEAALDVFDEGAAAPSLGGCEALAGGDAIAGGSPSPVKVFYKKNRFWTRRTGSIVQIGLQYDFDDDGASTLFETTIVTSLEDSYCEYLTDRNPETCVETIGPETGNYRTVEDVSRENYADPPLALPNCLVWRYTRTISAEVCSPDMEEHTSGPPIISSEIYGDDGSEILITTETPHHYITGEVITITGHSVGGVNGTFTITVLSPTTFTIPVEWEEDGEGGHALSAADSDGIPPGCASGFIGGCWDVAELPTETTYFHSSTLSMTWQTKAGIATVGSSAVICASTMTGWHVNEFGRELSDEFTTAELLSIANARLADAEYSEFAEGTPFAGQQLAYNESSVQVGEGRWKIAHYHTVTGYLRVWFGIRNGQVDGSETEDEVIYVWEGSPAGPLPAIFSEEYYLPHEGCVYRQVYVKKWSMLASYTPGDGQPDGFPP